MSLAGNPEEEIHEPTFARRLSVIVPALVLLGLLSYGMFTRAEPEPLGGTEIPDFELPLLGGGSMTDEDLQGKAVVLNFWASWCTPCREEAPMLERLWKEHGDHVLFLGVNTKDNELGARYFVDDYKITYPVLLDPRETLAGELDVYGLPQTFFIAKDGRFLGGYQTDEVGSQGDTVVLGAITEKTLREKIAQLLGTSETP
ncbi:MAG: TlpA family protein disulfide reductase [Actinomycetota bacterium]